MLPLKVFNSLPQNKREQIVRIVYGNMSEDFITKHSAPFHHNFNHEDGRWYKLMLDCCSYNKSKNHITVTIHIPV